MEIRIYVAQAVKDGDQFDLGVFENKDDAIKCAEKDRARQTEYDRNKTDHFVAAWDIECEEGQTIGDAYNEFGLNSAFTPDPVEFIEIK